MIDSVALISSVEQSDHYIYTFFIFFSIMVYHVKVKVIQSCPTLCEPMNYVNLWNSPGQNTRVGSRSLLQGIFPTQGLNPGLPDCRQILYQLCYQGSPRIPEWVAYPLSSRSSQPRSRTGSPALQEDSLPTEL